MVNDTGPRWGDEEDSDDDADSHADDIEIPMPNSGHSYLHPFTIGEYTVRTSGDFIFYMQQIYQLFYHNYPGSDPDSMWADLVQGLTDTSDTDNMDGASFDFVLAMMDIVITPEVFSGIATDEFNPAHLNETFSEEAKAALESAVAELTLDMFDEEMDATSFSVPTFVHQKRPNINPKKSDATPPLAPVCPDCPPVLLRLCVRNRQKMDLVTARTDWFAKIKETCPDFPADSLDGFFDDATTASSRSNRRPYEPGAVHIVYEDGSVINVGSHGYPLKRDHDYPINLDDSDYALQEFFASPGGEGLTCPTPSHILHQIVSAVIANAMSRQGSEVENDNIDVRVNGRADDEHPYLNIDVTTSAGIWNKKLGPDTKHPDYRFQAAISKYDMAAIIIKHCGGDVAECFAKSVGNCLSCEYPGLVRLDPQDMPEDLRMQAAIHDKLGSVSQNTLKDLGRACYEAAISESIMEASDVDINSQGMEWRKKRDILLDATNELKCRSNIAFPPLPLGDITPLPNDIMSITIRGHNFQTGSYLVQGRSQGPTYHMDSPTSFLQNFPASGIISEADASEIASVLDETPLESRGLSHRGPAEGFKGKDSVYMDAAGDVYGSSSSAQFAEIRSDLVRAIYKTPMPVKDTWAQVFLYKGKVACWYRCRDAPNSADGYRIDWFGVSSFETAGSVKMVTDQGEWVYLWPRQRLRSQEMNLVHMGPRRLKLMLYSMLEKSRAARTDHRSVILAWERLAITLNASTYASGKLFLTCRHLSSTLSSPSSPFHEMAKKLVAPQNYADIVYLGRLRKVLREWVRRDQYRDRSPLLGMSRAFSQAESYWMMWVPSDFADNTKNMASCVVGLGKEALLIELTMQMRVDDLAKQYDLLSDRFLTVTKLRKSLRESCTLDTKGKLGWTWIGSLASGHALNLRGSAEGFDRRYGRGTTARTMVDHMTVRHSARIDINGNLVKGTVAEMMLQTGSDNYLSTVNQTYRFLFINNPTFFNHPKSGEHKEREISITDPDSRICLTDAELICGKYGKTTGVDFLKDPAKNAKFYKTSSRVLKRGGGIQSSDATRYGPNMSNFAIAVMLLLLGTYSMHLRWASVVYARLAYRRMLIPLEIKSYLEQSAGHQDTRKDAVNTLAWIAKMPKACNDDGKTHVYYVTSHHMGQGMSHHSSSLLHAGGIIVAVDCVLRLKVVVKGKTITFKAHIMVTSDDSTILVEPESEKEGVFLNRSEKQVAARVFLQLIRAARNISLRMVSVLANLVKEMISATKGEFNSQDTGIGDTCPILGFRELISLVVGPAAPSLVGDFLNAHACARDVAFAGQGLSTGNIAHRILIDCIEERWGLNQQEKLLLHNLHILPKQLHSGCEDYELSSSPCSWLNPLYRASLYRMAVDKNVQSEDLDPHTRDTIFSPLMHMKVTMSRQHRKAISLINREITKYNDMDHPHQAHMLEESLRSTLSSARSRNLGRVAMRVRNRKILPRPYLDSTFERNTIIEHTLDWLSFLDRKVINDNPATADIRLSNHLAGYVKLVSRQRFGFPRPPRQRRFMSENLKKPKFRIMGYGSTPFGQHALKRSGTSVVPEITSVEREAVQEYIARTLHRKFSEHVEYGGSFVTSWATYECAIIVALDISADIVAQELEHMSWGSFSRSAIDILQTLQSEHEIPVLALHRHDGTRGLWHCIDNGVPRTVLLACNLDDHPGNGILHQGIDGGYVMLALQGIVENHKWSDTVPEAEEVYNYQVRPYDTFMPSIVRSVEDENMTSSMVTGATYATTIMHNDVETLIYSSPEIHSLPRNNPKLLPAVKHLRGRVVASLATGGYWHTSLRGTAFRAYLKGHFHENVIWTGQVLGWRASTTSVPVYFVTEAHTTNVHGLIILGGIDDPDMLSPFNPDIFSKGYKVMSESSTLTYSNCIRVDDSYVDFIVHHNLGNRFHVGTRTSTFLDFMHGTPQVATPPIPKADAADQIRRKLDDLPTETRW
jgi:hypothetical protein